MWLTWDACGAWGQIGKGRKEGGSEGKKKKNKIVGKEGSKKIFRNEG